MKKTFRSEFIAAAKESPRLFFAPLMGAINAVRDELRRISSADLEPRMGKALSRSRRHGRRK